MRLIPPFLPFCLPDSLSHSLPVRCIKFQATVSVIPIIPQSIDEVIESRILLRKNLLDLISYSADNEILVMPMESIGSGSLGYYVIYQG